jgi:polar amino acid transport system substrate-binding protein
MKTLVLNMMSCLLLSLASFSAHAQASAAQCDKVALQKAYPDIAGKSYKISLTTESKPFGYRDPNDFSKVVGFSADYAREVFDCLGARIEFVAAPFSAALPALLAKQVDMIWTPLYYTPQRAETVNLVLFQHGASGIVVPKGNPLKVAQPIDLCGKRVAAISGGTELVALRETDQACSAASKNAVDIMVSPDKASALRQLQNGRLDAYIGIGAPLAYDATMFEMPYVFATQTRVGVGLRKQDGTLANAVRDAVAALQKSGAEGQLYTKYQLAPTLSMPPAIATN